jgi:hypothetical protein
MAIRRPRRGASPNGRRRAKSPSTRKRPSGEGLLRAELTIMREIIVVLVRAITDLFDCLPKESFETEKVARIEATLANVHRALGERQRRWATEDNERADR